MVADLLDENPRRRRILRTLHRLCLASSLQRIQFRSFLGVSMLLPASLSASFLIRPYPARGGLAPSGSVPEGHRCRLRRTALPTAGPCAGPRLQSHTAILCLVVSREYSAKHRHHPVADPGIPTLHAWPPSAPGSSCQSRPWVACRSGDQKAFLSNCTSGGEIICERDSRGAHVGRPAAPLRVWFRRMPYRHTWPCLCQ